MPPKYKQLAVSPELHATITHRARIAEQSAGAYLEEKLAQMFAATPPESESPLPQTVPPLLPGKALAELLGVSMSAIRKGWRGEARWTVHIPGRVGRCPSLYPTRPLPITVEDAQRAAAIVCANLGEPADVSEIQSPDGHRYPAQPTPEAAPLFI
jgi:hypothetical protein